MAAPQPLPEPRADHDGEIPWATRWLAHRVHWEHRLEELRLSASVEEFLRERTAEDPAPAATPAPAAAPAGPERPSTTVDWASLRTQYLASHPAQRWLRAWSAIRNGRPRSATA